MTKKTTTKRPPSEIGCSFCNDGSCMICSLRRPQVVGQSSIFGRIQDMGELFADGDGNRHVKPKGAADKSPRPTVTTAEPHDHAYKSVICPICKLPFKDLYHHYSKHHPGVHLDLKPEDGA